MTLIAGLFTPDCLAENLLPENPYGVTALWAQGDWVAKTTLLILVSMSMASWFTIVTQLYKQNRMMHASRMIRTTFWRADSVNQGAQALATGSPFRLIAEKGIDSANQHDGLSASIDFNSWVMMSIQRAMNHAQHCMQDGLAILATIGSTAPFVGLFGTVWGIYHALVKIGTSGQASIDKVAGPVGESLIMTAIGLAVAVPAVLGYNWLIRRNKTIMENIHSFGADLHAVLLASGKK